MEHLKENKDLIFLGALMLATGLANAFGWEGRELLTYFTIAVAVGVLVGRMA